MRELDFDELDRAVNTLMGGVAPSAPAPSVDDDVKVIAIPSTLHDAPTPTMPRFTSPSRTGASPAAMSDSSVSETPVVERPTDQEAPAVAERADVADVPVSRLTIPSRRAGRFMDVVHPSSDMKNPSNAPSARPSRVASMITPTVATGSAAETSSVDLDGSMNELEQPSVVDTSYQVIAEPDTVANIVSLPTNDVVATDVAEPTEVTHDWPDPLAGFDDTPAESTSVAEIAPVVDTVAVASDDEEEAGDDDLFTIDTTDLEVDPEPLVSPFLSDAKVDKRPLGATGDQSGDEPGRAPVLGALAGSEMITSNPDDQLPPEPVSVAHPLPAELQGDLIAVESDNTDFATSEDVAESPEVVAPESAAMPASVSAQPNAPTGPTSIQQQYKESAATGDQSNGAIYDTKAYHAPLAHPVKKKSGWMWVIWVVLLLAVGAGGAVALYLSGII